ncbi:asparagine synthase (glutamine-hydrolyzing) [Candidatus Woesearchaeota archaeon]|nr:MAG: asparagine synthase (glutamine-hydrolyzing) [Candidatus Woesearchaeota archaeon]
MCGIVGVIGPHQPSERILQRMVRALQHRGPDDEGFYRSNGVSLGHRRLSIIDLSSAGRQPLLACDGDVALVYNGELYNYKELRRELVREGYHFSTKTDSEVVLKAYLAWGIGAVERFNGMFAFALWDARSRTAHLVRDRFGVKPLYYTVIGSELFFASEAKALFAHPACKPRLNLDALNQYLTFQNVLSNDTFFSGITLLKPATILTFDGTGLREHCYWKQRFLDPATAGTHEDIVNELRTRFATAVKRQLVSDVPVSAYLSSGIDSSSIVAVAAQHTPSLNTFTCGFAMEGVQGYEATFDERALALTLARHLGTNQAAIEVGPRDMEQLFAKLIFHLETPRLGMSFPNMAIARCVAESNKVVLAGTGGDELFGGYPWRYLHALGHSTLEDYAQQYYTFWQRLIPDEEKPLAYGAALAGVDQSMPRKIFEELLLEKHINPQSPQECIKNALAFEFTTFLQGLLLIEDHLGMAYSLETRFPFLDNDLVDFAMTLPISSLFSDELQLSADKLSTLREQHFEATQGKRALRDALSCFVPKEVAQRKKQGFSAPVGEWFRHASRPFVERHLLAGELVGSNLLRKPYIEEKLSEHLSGTKDHRLLIWSLLSLEFWLRTWSRD